ncbi:hypothetical protein SAICODRAFT_29082 [Saitoella complicata NRRL Y-17804]|uniref:uncharacterized protein n=1 Tax=Saitoella complicata (strain BCRC 22490 / CBS 7301 / JCM 7358 / NBRC 10748 / NRRL Y-17804) TaxID=698492 RepID=UPI0008670AAB|nr:uncharacterized protein SAICODRAFT_29082 [Saitoella complicata NRRL Y-17804]ODQ55523.1 hypothetical protein SAICODRAFT_29082 [Saitoella complicata NRRL Y-17804]
MVAPAGRLFTFSVRRSWLIEPDGVLVGRTVRIQAQLPRRNPTRARVRAASVLLEVSNVYRELLSL